MFYSLLFLVNLAPTLPTMQFDHRQFSQSKEQLAIEVSSLQFKPSDYGLQPQPILTQVTSLKGLY